MTRGGAQSASNILAFNKYIEQFALAHCGLSNPKVYTARTDTRVRQCHCVQEYLDTAKTVISSKCCRAQRISRRPLLSLMPRVALEWDRCTLPILKWMECATPHGTPPHAPSVSSRKEEVVGTQSIAERRVLHSNASGVSAVIVRIPSVVGGSLSPFSFVGPPALRASRRRAWAPVPAITR